MFRAFDFTGRGVVVTGGNGGIAVFLASDASSYATGEQFVSDGGYTRF